MARDDNKCLDGNTIPEDSGSHKVSVSYVFDPERNMFYPSSEDLYSTEPRPHRSDVTQVDTEDPEFGVNCVGFKRCRFDIEVIGSKIRSLKVVVLRWNSAAEKWFSSGTNIELIDMDGFSASGGRVTLIENEAFGAVIFLKVSEFTGDAFALNAYNILC